MGISALAAAKHVADRATYLDHLGLLTKKLADWLSLRRIGADVVAARHDFPRHHGTSLYTTHDHVELGGGDEVRKYETTSIDQLEAFVASGLATKRQLTDIRQELTHRATKRAAALLSVIVNLLHSTGPGSKVAFNANRQAQLPHSDRPLANALRSAKPPLSRIVRCSVCDMPAIPGDSVCFTHNN